MGSYKDNLFLFPFVSPPFTSYKDNELLQDHLDNHSLNLESLDIKY